MEPANNEAKIIARIVGIAVVSLILLITLFSVFVTIPTGELGVKTRVGRVVGVMEPGMHAKAPFIEKVEKINVRTQVIKNEHFVNEKGQVVSDNALAAASKDLQDVKVSTVVNYRIDQAKVQDIYTQYRTEGAFEESVVKPIIKEVVKSITANYTAEELVTKRNELNTAIIDTLSAKFTDKMAVFEQGNVTNIEFSQSFTEAIERKVTAEQDALAAKNKLAQTEYEAQQQVVTAKATAEAQRIQSQSLAAQGGEDFVNLKAIEKWNGVLPVQMIPGSTVPFINLNQ